MTYNPAEQFLKDIKKVCADFVAETHDEDVMDFDEFIKLDMLRDDIARATLYMVQMKFDLKPMTKAMNRAITDMLMVVDQFNELCAEELE